MEKQRSVIFDLGGVLLVEPDANIQKAMTFEWNIDFYHDNVLITKIFNRMFDFINLIYGRDCKKDWFLGKISYDEMLQKIKSKIDQTEYDQFFKDSTERNLIKHGSELILIPEKNASLVDLDLQGFEFVKKCKQSGARVLVLSNWEVFSFKIIRKQFSILFDLFHEKDVFTPINLGFIKPESEAFIQIIRVANLAPATTFFVDDSTKNIEVARKFGLQAVHHQDWNSTSQKLKLNGLISC